MPWERGSQSVKYVLDTVWSGSWCCYIACFPLIDALSVFFFSHTRHLVLDKRCVKHNSFLFVTAWFCMHNFLLVWFRFVKNQWICLLLRLCCYVNGRVRLFALNVSSLATTVYFSLTATPFICLFIRSFVHSFIL